VRGEITRMTSGSENFSYTSLFTDFNPVRRDTATGCSAGSSALPQPRTSG
jgi:hypothetical protein